MEQKKGERHGYISTAQRLESTPLSGKVKAFVFYPMLISSKIHSEFYFFKKRVEEALGYSSRTYTMYMVTK